MNLTILGSNSAVQIFDRHPTSQILELNGDLYLIDCGEGTGFRLNTFKFKRNKIKAIFISHLHGDHYYGLIGLLTTMSLNQRKSTLSIVCPDKLKEIIELQTTALNSNLNFDINYIYHDDQSTRTVYEDSNIKVSNIPLTHKIMTCGFRFEKKFRDIRIDSEKLFHYGIEGVEVRELIDKREIIKGDKTISLDDVSFKNDEKIVYSYCSDTRYDEKYFDIISESNVLYHESTFLDELKEKAEETKHSTAREAGIVAKKTNAKKLLIGHFSSRYKDLTPLLEEARSIFENTELALEGKTFEIK